MAEQKYDLAVVGGGPGGYVAAIRASQLGLKTSLVEEKHLGGICLNWGCIPTKALLHCSEIQHTLNNLDAYGFSAKDIHFDIQKIVARSRAVADQLSKGVAYLLKKNKIDVIDGRARLAGKGRLVIEKANKKTSEIAAAHILLATGARAKTLPGLEPDGKRVWTYMEAMVPKEFPKSILVIGSGAIGIEFASFYRNLGAEVTVVEILDRILPVEDEEISKFAKKAFEKQGIRILTKTTIEKLNRGKGGLSATLCVDGKRERIEADRAIVAVGITGNVEDLGIEGTKIKVAKGHVVVNEWLETGEAGVYAIGDLVGPPWLAHKASHEGVICVEHIARVKGARPLDVLRVPGCTYSMPQIASIGMTEKAAKAAGFELRIGRFPYHGNGKAIALGAAEGFVKTLFDKKSGELLGAHIIGADATELIQGYIVARSLEATEADLIETIFPHPTLSEMLHESVLDAYDRAIHS
ncbi:MAG: dihydrolipoyl dehydrogenase [Rhodospirillaceae bacterium]|nr:MAG: dihydrolipoyl dehydrogenase [Rhodospirillaceae bacterium]